MCGRFVQATSPELLAKQFGVTTPLPEGTQPSWNVTPSAPALVVRRNPESGKRHLDLLVWGLVPNWTKDLTSARRPINARAETVTSTTMFSPSFAKRRCLVPVDVWYEWKAGGKTKQPYAFAAHTRAPIALGGIWESWRADGTGKILRTFALITTTPNAVAWAVHDRMPVVVPPEAWSTWLGEQIGDPTDLLQPASDDLLEAWPVSRAVGNTRNNGPEMLRPLDI